MNTNIKVYNDSVLAEISAHDTFRLSRAWPDSRLGGKELAVAFDSTGVCAVFINNKPMNQVVKDADKVSRLNEILATARYMIAPHLKYDHPLFNVIMNIRY